MKRVFYTVALAVVLAIGVGCASSGAGSGAGPSTGVQLQSPVVLPKSFGESLIYGYVTNAAARRGATAGLNAKLISKSDAQHVLDTTNTVRTALDEARKAGCPAMTTEPKDGDKPACLDNLPPTLTGKLTFAVGLADQAFGFLKTVGAVK